MVIVEKRFFAELEVTQGELSKKVILKTILVDDGKAGLRLTLTDGENVWKGQVNEEELDKLSSRLKMDFDKFVAQTVSALTREGPQEIMFEYQLKVLPSDRMQLVWKKCVSSDSIKYQLGHVNLERQEAPSPILASMLSRCVQTVSSYKHEVEILKAENERLARDRNSAIKRLDKCVAAKAEVEADLFSKFVAILNCKKEKIRELEEDRLNEVPSITTSSPDPGPSTSKVDSLKGSKRKVQPLSSPSHVDDGASYAVDTDEEGDETPPKRTRTTLKTVSSLENSINLGDEEEETSTAPVARRARRKVPAKKPSISKPVLPKVTASPASLDRSSSVRKTSLRKSGSGSSKGSVNTEDLLDQM